MSVVTREALRSGLREELDCAPSPARQADGFADFCCDLFREPCRHICGFSLLFEDGSVSWVSIESPHQGELLVQRQPRSRAAISESSTRSKELVGGIRPIAEQLIPSKNLLSRERIDYLFWSTTAMGQGNEL